MKQFYVILHKFERKMLRFLVIFLLYELKFSHAIEGVIWNKNKQTFVPLFSISNFLEAKVNHHQKLREYESRNFHKESLKVAYYSEPFIMNFIDNNTKVSGICGDIWTILADYLNFTLVPIEIEEKKFGNKLENDSYDGLLGLIQRNETQVIARSGIYINRLPLLEYTMPFWRIRYRIYIKPEWKHDEAWMFHLFSKEVVFSFFLTLIALSIAGYICEKYSLDSNKEKSRLRYQDCAMYTVAVATSQGYDSIELYDKSRLIHTFTSIISWVFLIAFNSHAILLMMNKKFVLPFTDLKSLIQESNYNIAAFRGSMVHQLFKDTITKYFRDPYDVARVTYTASSSDFYEEICYSNKRLAVFDAEDRHKSLSKDICNMISTRASYFETWIASAVKRGFLYKRSIDLGILKMEEAGLIDGLKDRWLKWKREKIEHIPFRSIDISQVYLIFCILFIGLLTSMIVLLIEYLTFFRSKFLRCKYKRHKKSIISKERF